MNTYNISKLKLISLVTGAAVILLFSLDQPSWAELIVCPSPPAPCVGTAGDDIILGEGNTIYGMAGDDYILSSGTSPNYIYGENGNDRLIGSHGNDALFGGAGNDYYDGGLGSDVIAEDLWVGGAPGTLVFSNDVISGAEGDDYIISGLGSDRIHGGPGNDIIYPNGYHRDFSFDIINCGSGTGDQILSSYSGDSDTTVNCEQITDFDR